MIIEPLIKKVTNIDCKSITGKFHRLLWAPLYYPETIIESLNNTTSFKLKTEFHYTLKQPISCLVQALLARLEKSNTTTIIDPDLSNYGQYLNQNTTWMLPLTSCLPLMDKHPVSFEQVSVGILYIRVHKKYLKNLISQFYILDKSIPFYRITNHSYLMGLDTDQVSLLIEFNPIFAHSFTQLLSKNNELKKVIIEHLSAVHILHKHSVLDDVHFKIFESALKVPSRTNISQGKLLWEKAHALYSDVIFSGSATPFWKHSLNDQIIQGIKTAHQLIKNMETTV